ncbi:MAG TPA: SDR family oxidoreductase [Ktedonobacterales bacterium]
MLRVADLRNKVVFITGGSRGLGYALAEEFAKHGAHVAICARDERELATTRQRFPESGSDVVTIQCDVSKREQAERAVADITARFGRIDILVNSAGIIAVGPVQAQAVEDFEEVMAINFWGALYTTLAVLPQMERRHDGRIVNITSIGGKVSVPHLLPYSSAKFAFVGFSEGLRAELAKAGVTVVTIVPGLMRTGSSINALVKGSHRAEFAWFSLLDSLPLASISVRRAVRQIMRATLRGDAERVLSPQARILALAHGVAPGFTADLMGLVNRLLPGAGGDEGGIRRTGRESQSPISRSFLTVLSQRAAERYNQNVADWSREGGGLPSEETSSTTEIISSV